MADLPADRLASLAQLVSEMRNKRNLTRQACARVIGISRVTLRAIERGDRHQPTQETLTKVAHFLRLPLEQLTGHYAAALDLAGTHLRPEDHQIAREFHHAATDVKVTLKAYFSGNVTDDQRERLARILRALLDLKDDPLIASVETLIASAAPDDQDGSTVERQRKKR